MTKRGRPRAWPSRGGELEPEEIDRLYDLEPVFEPGGSHDHIAPQELVTVSCPYCGELLHTRVDLTAAETTYVEDCQVCCRPIELTIERAACGELSAVTAQRAD